MNSFVFGDFKAEIDVTDVSFVETYEGAAEAYNEEIRKVPQDGKASEQMRCMCEVFFRAFDRIFGEGTHEKMFGNKMSVDACVQAFQELVRTMGDYSETLKKMEMDMLPAAKPQKGRSKK